MGYIVVSDLKDFSTEPNDVQERLVRKMWEVLRQQALFLTGGAITNSTGDGVVVAFPCNEIPVTNAQVFEFVLGWRSGLDRQFPLKIALHQGPFQILEIEGYGLPQIVGNPINACSRFVSYSEPDKLVVSDAFWSHWGVVCMDTRAPFEDKVTPPIAIRVKHGLPETIRIFSDPFGQGAPLKLREYQDIHNKILALLGDIEDSTNAFFKAACVGFKPTRAKLRVTILAPKRDRNKGMLLVPTSFRSSRYREDRNLESRTFYSLKDELEQGPAARAFKSGKSQVVHDLPDKKSGETAYYKALERIGIPTPLARGFSAPSRAFLDIPFGIVEGKTDGVLCLDFLDPLASLKKREIRSFCERVRDAYSHYLALLWRARIQ